MKVLNFNPSSWTEGDWEIVESAPQNNNTWTLVPWGGYTHISIDGGVPVPWTPEGIRFRFEDRVCMDFEYLGEVNV